MSDANDDFRPMDPNSLESFEGEQSMKTPQTEPDFDRFKLLFDPKQLEIKEEDKFEALYSFVKEVKDSVFEPLIKEPEPPKAPPVPDEPSPPKPDAPVPPGDEGADAPEVAAEKLGFEKGFRNGLAQGVTKGEADGFKKGEADGFAKGEAQGFAKGEAEGLAAGEAQGYEKGFQEGRAAAEAEVAQEAAGILDPLKEALATTDQALGQLLHRYEQQIVGLVYQIAEKAVAATLEMDEAVVKHTILDALNTLVSPEEISLSVSAEDYEYVEMVKDEFFEAVRSLKHVAVLSDAMIPKGGCRIETGSATLSTDPESKLSAVYDALMEARRS